MGEFTQHDYINEALRRGIIDTDPYAEEARSRGLINEMTEPEAESSLARGENVASALPDEDPSLGNRALNFGRELFGLDPVADEPSESQRSKNLASAQNELAFEIMGEERPSNIPEQVVSGFTEGLTAGLADTGFRDPINAGERVAKGAGGLGGFILGAPVQGAKVLMDASRLTKTLRIKGTDRLRKQLAKKIGEGAAFLGTAFGIGAVGDALDEKTVADAARKIRNRAGQGAMVGATFSGANMIIPRADMLGWAARIGLSSAILDSIHGQHPLDDRDIADKAFDYGLTAFFTRKPQVLFKPPIAGEVLRPEAREPAGPALEARPGAGERAPIEGESTVVPPGELARPAQRLTHSGLRQRSVVFLRDRQS